MKLFVTLHGSSRYNPIIKLIGGSGRLHMFGWSNELNCHVWVRSPISENDSKDLDDIFSSRDPYYKLAVKIASEPEPTIPEPSSIIRQEEPVAVVKKQGRPRKVAA